ncbi:MAG: hypothetical protein JWN44_226 [Myxococcales bacterium]|nr:hypothetical protein [Myxococcales bacterium]
MSELQPTPPRERLLTLDVLRGCALLGVLLGNVYDLYCGRRIRAPEDHGRLDTAARFLVEVLVQSKAQTLLCFLFGFGFAAQLVRARQRQQPVLPLYLRRLVVLFCFGCLHLLVFWGDVTWTYAVAGFALLLFLRSSNRTRLGWAVLLGFVPSIILPFGRVYEALTAPFGGAHAHWAHINAELEAAITTHSMWIAARKQLVVAALFEVPSALAYFPWVVARFLVGFVAGEQGWFARDGADHLPLFRRVLAVAAPVGVAASGFVYLLHHGRIGWQPPPKIWQIVLALLARQLDYLGLAATYLAAVVLLMQRPRVRRVLALLAPVGRMPLTTFLSQSLICTASFYGWGLGRAFTLRSAACVGLALAIFALQVLVAQLWLRRFRFGPAEWLWRALVYLQRPPMRVR